MPLHTLSKSIGIVLSTTLFLFLFLLPVGLLQADEQESLVLPSMTVFANKKSDNTFTQRSEVAWVDANDPTIVHESDGTYTAKSTTNSYSLKTLLAALGSPTVNVDLNYASNSVSLTADGNRMLGTLVESFDYLSSDGAVVKLTPTLGTSEKASKKIMLRRLEVLVNTLATSTQVKLKVMPAKLLSGGTEKHRLSEAWRIHISRDS